MEFNGNDDNTEKKLIKMIKGDLSSNVEKLSFFLVGEMTVATMKNNNYRTKDLFLFDRHPKLFTDMNIKGDWLQKNSIRMDFIMSPSMHVKRQRVLLNELLCPFLQRPLLRNEREIL